MRADLIVLLMSMCFDDVKTVEINGSTFISALIDYLNVHEIILLKRDNDSYDYLKMQGLLSELKSSLFVSVLSYHHFPRVAARGYENSLNPLVIIDSDDPNFNITYLSELSEKANFSPFKWVVTCTKCDPEDYEIVKIPFNCEFIIAEGSDSSAYKLTEIYDTTTINNVMLHLGKWSRENGLEVSQLDFFTRRNNLRESVYNISVSSSDPCGHRSVASQPVSAAKCIHFTMLPIIAEALNFSINWIVLDEKNCYGWKVLVPPYIEFSQCDIIALGSDDSPTFIWPSFKNRVKIYVGYTIMKMEWATYISPFSKFMWIAFWIWIALSAGCLGIAEFCLMSTVTKRPVSFIKMWMKNLFLSFSASCCQGVGREPEGVSRRILFYLIFLIPTALLPGYSASLTSYLTSKEPNLPFSDLQGMANAKDFKLAYRAQFDLSIIIKRNSGEISRLIYDELLLPQNELPELEEEGLRRICNEKLSWLSAVYDVDARSPSCRYFELDSPVTYFTALPVVSNSHYKVLINRIMRRIVYNGILKRISTRVVGRQLPIADEDSLNVQVADSIFVPIIIENVVSLYVILSIGIVASCIILCLEIMSSNHSTLRPVRKILP